MRVLLAYYQIRLFDVHSLKEKRSIVKRLINKLRKKFNLAITESDFHDNKQMLEISIVTLSKDKDFLISFFETIEEEIETEGFTLYSSEFEIL